MEPTKAFGHTVNTTWFFIMQCFYDTAKDIGYFHPFTYNTFTAESNSQEPEFYQQAG